jgi:hypothetical protein
MTRRTLFSTLAAMLVAFAVSFVATTGSASAQCCTYRIDVRNFPVGCFPFDVYTLWGMGVAGPVPIGGNGVTVHNVPWACPPVSPFFGASINAPAGPWASLNNIRQYFPNGCCAQVRIAFDAAGCPVITIRPC